MRGFFPFPPQEVVDKSDGRRTKKKTIEKIKDHEILIPLVFLLFLLPFCTLIIPSWRKEKKRTRQITPLSSNHASSVPSFLPPSLSLSLSLSHSLDFQSLAIGALSIIHDNSHSLKIPPQTNRSFFQLKSPVYFSKKNGRRR